MIFLIGIAVVIVGAVMGEWLVDILKYHVDEDSYRKGRGAVPFLVGEYRDSFK